jgi:hypothetical protein
MQHLRDIESHFPEVFDCVSNDGLIRKIQSAAKHGTWPDQGLDGVLMLTWPFVGGEQTSCQ